MDLQKKYLILGLILFAFCELSATTGLCRFARMFPNQGKTQSSKDDTSKKDKVVTCEGDDLPKVQHGWFDCPRKTNVSLGNVCNLTCDVGFHPTSTKQAVCEVGEDVPVGCDTNHLPYVTNGFFQCPPDSKVSLGDACNLTCDVGFYPLSSDQAVCEAGMVGGHRGNWSQGNFACNVVTCNRNDLPDVLDGSFDCPGSTDVFIGDVCNVTCSWGFYPTSTNQTVCEPGVTGNRNGKWSEGNFSCQVATCYQNDLPEVVDGSFHCSGITDIFIGDVCNLTCFYGFYPTSTNQTVCKPEVTGNRNGKWSKGNFACQDCSDLLDGRIYRFVLDKMSLSNARENCQSLNSSLAFIESEEEDNFVHQLLLKCAPDKGPWEGWTWTGNKPIASDNGYNNWDTDEPNAKVNSPLCPKEECVGMKYDSGKWHDQCCNREFYSVCEQNE